MTRIEEIKRTGRCTRSDIDAFEVAVYNQFEKHNDRVEVQRLGSLLDNKVKYGVNWSCVGTVDQQEAKDMAEALMQASAIAEKMNRLQLSVDFEAPHHKTSQQDIAEWETFIEEAIAQFAGIRNMETR